MNIDRVEVTVKRNCVEMLKELQQMFQGVSKGANLIGKMFLLRYELRKQMT